MLGDLRLIAQVFRCNQCELKLCRTFACVDHREGGGFISACLTVVLPWDGEDVIGDTKIVPLPFEHAIRDFSAVIVVPVLQRFGEDYGAFVCGNVPPALRCPDAIDHMADGNALFRIC